jgi:hypothetical protein
LSVLSYLAAETSPDRLAMAGRLKPACDIPEHPPRRNVTHDPSGLPPYIQPKLHTLPANTRRSPGLT